MIRLVRNEIRETKPIKTERLDSGKQPRDEVPSRLGAPSQHFRKWFVDRYGYLRGVGPDVYSGIFSSFKDQIFC